MHPSAARPCSHNNTCHMYTASHPSLSLPPCLTAEVDVVLQDLHVVGDDRLYGEAAAHAHAARARHGGRVAHRHAARDARRERELGVGALLRRQAAAAAAGAVCAAAAVAAAAVDHEHVFGLWRWGV